MKRQREFSWPRLAAGRRAFTLVELLLVVGIMGLLGTVSVGGFHALRKGVEQRSVMQTVDEFVRAAYRRAVIDRVPTAVYYWNETVSDEGDETGGKLVVVGHAVAVRRAGRLSLVDGSYLIDEFGDLDHEKYLDADGEEDSSAAESSSDPGRYLYKVGDSSFSRSVVATSTVLRELNEKPPTSQTGLTQCKIRAYAYYLRDRGGIDWETGDAYGFEFAELTLPKNFIFGSGNDYSTSVTDPEKPLNSVTLFLDADTVRNARVDVAGLTLDNKGAVSYKKIGTTDDPTQERD